MNLIKILILSFFVTALISCGGAEERKAVYLEKAKISFAAGDIDKARIDLKNVLQIDPKDGEAYFYLGKVFEQQKELRKAYGNYKKAEELKPELLVNQAKLGIFYLLLMNDLEKAQEKIDFILSKEPNNPDGLLLKASYLIKEKNIAEATSIIEGILSRNPSHNESVQILAKLYIQDKRLDDAIKILDLALDTDINNEVLNKLLASILVENKEYDRAEVIYTGFLERNPNSIASYTNLAVFYNLQGDTAKAEKILRSSIENNSDDVNRVLALVKYIGLTKDKDTAIKELETISKSKPGDGELKIILAKSYLSISDKQSAINVLEQAIADFSEEVTGVKARSILSSLYIGNSEFDKASKVLDDALSISPNDADVNFLRARLALRDKDLEKAIISLRIVTKETPENIEAFLLLANAYELEGNKEQVHGLLNSAYNSNKTNAKGLIKLAKYQLTRDIVLSEKIIDDFNAVKENDYEGLSIKTAILYQNKEHLAAYKIAQKLKEEFPDKPNGYLQSVQYLVSIKDQETALSILEKGYMNVDENRKILTMLTTIQIGKKQFDIVESRLNAEIKAHPDAVDLRILLSKAYVVQKKLAQAEKTLEEAIAVNKKFEEAYILLSHIYQNNKKLSKSKSVLITGKDNIPASLKIPFRLASLYEQEQSYGQAIDVYKSMNEAQPKNLVVMNNLASMLSDYGDDQEDLVTAKSFIDELIKSKELVFLDTVGWVYYKLGDYKNSIDNLSQVVSKMADVNIFNYHLGMAYKMDGNKEQAKVYLEKSLADNKPFKQRQQAETALQGL